MIRSLIAVALLLLFASDALAFGCVLGHVKERREHRQERRTGATLFTHASVTKSVVTQSSATSSYSRAPIIVAPVAAGGCASGGCPLKSVPKK